LNKSRKFWADGGSCGKLVSVFGPSQENICESEMPAYLYAAKNFALGLDTYVFATMCLNKSGI
jgi:hypothetical protein